MTHTRIRRASSDRLFVEKGPLCPAHSPRISLPPETPSGIDAVLERGKSFLSHRPEWKPRWESLWLFNTKMGDFIQGLLSGQLRFLTEPSGHPAGDHGALSSWPSGGTARVWPQALNSAGPGLLQRRSVAPSGESRPQHPEWTSASISVP